MNIVVFTGAGVSADSGISTFRDHGGLWDKHRIEDVATPEAFARNPQLVLDFYNTRFRQLQTVHPNPAHEAIARLQEKYHVQVVTQNVDNLHERAGSTNVLHLHGELTKCRSTGNDGAIFDMPAQGLQPGDKCPAGFQLRPHIVWFGELVPAMDAALEVVSRADVLLIVGTSLQVYPAAGLAFAAKPSAGLYVVDPGDVPIELMHHVVHIRERAATGVPSLVEKWLAKGVG